MRINHHHHQRGGGGRIQSNKRILTLSTFFLVFVGCIILISQETDYINSSSGGIKGEWLQSDNNDVSNNNVRREQISTHNDQSQHHLQRHMNHFSLSPGELPGYTGWSRPEQTLAGYFDTYPLSHPTNNLLQSKYHSTVNSGDKFSILLTCNHKVVESEEEDDEPPYECPPEGGILFYVRAYGPNVITGLVTDHHNSSYSIEMQFIDPGEYTLEVVTTFSVPLDYNEFPIDDEDESSIEPGYEGYLVSGFPLSILVHPKEEEVDNLPQQKPWCTLSQLTESSPQSALYKGHWEVIDTVARLSHQPLTPDETQVSLDGYRMGLNSVGVRMAFEYEDCELIHIRDLAGGFHGGMDVCFNEHLGFNIPIRERWIDNSTESANQTTLAIDDNGNNSEDINFEGVHVIFIGDSVMRLTRYFFLKLVKWSRGIKVTMIETNGGIHATLQDITSTLETIREQEEKRNVKRVIFFNSGLHDVDILCSSKRKRSRNGINITNSGLSCQDAYRDGMTKFIHMLDDYPAEMKVFRSTTAGKIMTLSLFIYCIDLTFSYTPHNTKQVGTRYVLLVLVCLYYACFSTKSLTFNQYNNSMETMDFHGMLLRCKVWQDLRIYVNTSIQSSLI